MVPSIQGCESQTRSDDLKDELLTKLSSFFRGRKVESRGTAFTIFSDVLVFSRLLASNEQAKKIWLNFLEQQSFSLYLENKELKKYNFSTIIDLINSGKNNFEIDIVDINPQESDLKKVGEIIDSFVSELFGNSFGKEYFSARIASPNTMSLLVKDRNNQDNIIACSYGTYFETPEVKFFYINFIGRRFEYPGIKLIEKMQNEMIRLLIRFPHVQYLTLSTPQENNDHTIKHYEEIGFKKIADVPLGNIGKPLYFYGKKIDPDPMVQPPTYIQFKALMSIVHNEALEAGKLAAEKVSNI